MGFAPLFFCIVLFLVPVGSFLSYVSLHFGGTGTMGTGNVFLLFGLCLYLVFLWRLVAFGPSTECDASKNYRINVVSSEVAHVFSV